jgi:hypothetical protein
MRVNHKNNCSNCEHTKYEMNLLHFDKGYCSIKQKIIDITKNLKCPNHTKIKK